MDFVILVTVKPAHVVTSIKEPPVLRGHPCPFLSKKISYELNHL